MIKNGQKAVLHIYADAAGLAEQDYREILKREAHVRSAADPDMSQGGFERAMAVLETTLWERVESGVVPDPRGRVSKIGDPYYWRSRRPAAGYITSRQAHMIETLWARLQEHLPPEDRNVEYLARMLHRATGKRDIGYAALRAHEAAWLINALIDRLAHAVRIEQEDPVPF
jgi:hypothetical protein